MVGRGGSLDKALAAFGGQEYDASGGVESCPATSTGRHVSSKTSYQWACSSISHRKCGVDGGIVLMYLP